ncbi:galactose oxidase [uncultured Chitinophaga sp.]|uniref:galactose oxidase n=1 Tax=uncultured Chitinophaga sp. TaxID=339340 RepID=UPI0025E95754|nr:galactose oxidase [uncultured Chitinophaga sp.]
MAESCLRNEVKVQFEWGTLPPIPDSTGFAGSFAGTAGNVLLVAGGSNFPNGGTPWNGGTKVWYDKIFALETAGGSWKEVGKLPRPLGYGVSISTAVGLICIGGSNAGGHYNDAFIITYSQGQAVISSLPSLPVPLANTSGAMADSCIYVAGGIQAPDAKVTSNGFYMLDLRKPAAWQTLPPVPGASRMLAVAGALGNEFFLFSGATLKDGKRGYLKDAWRYSKTEGWRACAEMPHATVAAPSCAYPLNKHTLVILGGDTGDDADSAAVLRERHPGFSKAILAYDAGNDTWQITGDVYTRREADAVTHPNNSIWAPVTTTSAYWNGCLVLPGGEVRPGTRTPNVITVKFKH